MSRLNPHVPIGCDQQGRYPEAGHACSEFLTEEDLDSYQAYEKYIGWAMAACAATMLSFVVYLVFFFT